MIGCLGLVWGFSILPGSEASEDFRDFEGHLLRSETFDLTILAQAVASSTSQNVGPCDTHVQNALLLMELPLAEAALRTGAVSEFDRRIRSLESRSRLVLSCTPRDSLVWLVAFNLEVLHGLLNDHSFKLLAMSYETSPNEAWISIRRIVVAMPIILLAPEPLQENIITEFQQLIRNGFVTDAGRAYLRASQPVRSFLQPTIEQLDAPHQRMFSDALRMLRS
jgi:hypothetical protein